MNINVLISCMHQKDADIIHRTNIQTDVVVVNQCDNDKVSEFDFQNKKGKICHAKFINTKERGLSRSRNMAINNSWGDVCLICDDDEYLEDDYDVKISEAYQNHPEEKIIVFTIERNDYETPKQYPPHEQYVGLKQLLQTSSVQVTFKREEIKREGLLFDVMLGSGTGNGAGEENKFLMDCKRKGFKIYYVPICLGAVLTGNSTWFKGYTPQFMKNQGWTSRRALGTPIGFCYIMSYGLRHRALFKKDGMNMYNVYKYLLQGFFEKRN